MVPCSKKCTSRTLWAWRCSPQTKFLFPKRWQHAIQQQSKTSGVLVHAAWSMVSCKALAMATLHRLPNGFRWWDLALAQLTCRSTSNCLFKGHFPAAWAA